MGKSKKKENMAKLAAFLGDDVSFSKTLSLESARGKALVGAAILETGLEALIRARLVDASTEIESLVNADGPLGSFSNRIRLAYCLGLVSKDEQHDLEMVRRIRNGFAHSFEGRTFEDVPGAVDKCKDLRAINTFAETIKADPWQNLTPEERFVFTVAVLAAQLKIRSGEVHHLDELPPARWTLKGRHAKPE